MKENSLTVKQIAKLIDIKYHGNPDLIISGVANLNEAQVNQLAFLFDKKYFKDIENTKASCLLVNNKFPINDNFTFLISDNPKLSMAQVLELFSINYNNYHGVHSSAFVSENVVLGENISINSFVHIGSGITIGNNVTIMSNCFIGDNSVIADNSYIYPNVSVLANSVIGENVIIHSGTVIGSDGYGFIQLSGNQHYKVPQIGNVIIENDVEIGSGVSIDRGTIGSTVIGQGTKIDNHVHIAHNVKIGKRCLIVAQVGIAGSTTIGDNVIIAGQSGITGHIEIGSNSLIYSRSGVTKNIPDNSKVSGFPARNHLEEIRNQALLKKVPDLIKEIENLKKLISEK